MHSKNGREIQRGDKLLVKNGNYSYTGVVAETIPGATSCNVQVVPLCNAQSANASDCIHLEDAFAAPQVTASEPTTGV